MTHEEAPSERPDLYQRIIEDSSLPLENLTGCYKRYAPTSTTQEKYSAWEPIRELKHPNKVLK